MLIEHMFASAEEIVLSPVPDSPALPNGFATMAPGVTLLTMLSGLDSPSLSRFERVGVITAWRRMVSHCQAAYYREIAALYEQELGEGPEALVEDSAWAVKTELGAALHLSNRGAELEFERALLLARAPGVGKALSEGPSISTGRRCWSTAPVISPMGISPG